jgi:hypothetical protein
MMFSFTLAERIYLKTIGAICKDPQGREVLVGLSLEETEFYMGFAAEFHSGEMNSANARRYLELHERHEAARFRALDAELHLRIQGQSAN